MRRGVCNHRRGLPAGLQSAKLSEASPRSIVLWGKLDESKDHVYQISHCHKDALLEHFRGVSVVHVVNDIHRPIRESLVQNRVPFFRWLLCSYRADEHTGRKLLTHLLVAHVGFPERQVRRFFIQHEPGLVRMEEVGKLGAEKEPPLADFVPHDKECAADARPKILFLHAFVPKVNKVGGEAAALEGQKRNVDRGPRGHRQSGRCVHSRHRLLLCGHQV
mmetsp:Transcript_21089/g.67221  ORF Transcript_21089/g.67221 Transcript_21089/m.67221 type:complete len:219 (-) Transcript_21089:627-1283(-)